MKSETKKWLKFAVRWGIAIAGIWYVVANIHLADRVMVLHAQTNEPVYLRVLDNAGEDEAVYRVIAADGQTESVERDDIWTPADRKKVHLAGHQEPARLLAMRPAQPGVAGIAPAQLLVRVEGQDRPMVIQPIDVQGGYSIQVPYPLVDVGLTRRIREADPTLLWAAILIFPITYLITGLRWYYLMRPLGIRMSAVRAFVLNVVGMFYSTFMPGSTGGDLVKAYYASKHTTNRTRAIMSVIVDRAIGLLSLIVLGGAMAVVQYFMAESKQEPVAQSSLKVALLCFAILFATGLGLVLFFNQTTRRYLGLDFVLRKLPMQSQVQRAIEVMAIYRQHKWLAFAALIGTLPVHATVVVSAMLAGMAFDLPLPAAYYFVCVPVIVLVGAIPISPQGAGVMEFFAIRLTERHGATIAQAFILTMSIRLVQMFWNLLGGIFVLRGGYNAPTTEEARELNMPAGATVPAPE
jgi:glycosyltransferase 2 family protein